MKKKQAIIFINAFRDNDENLSQLVENELKQNNWDVACLIAGKSSLDNDLIAKADIAISLGGDGTFLFAARAAAPFGIPILPIHYGTLGFIAWVNKEDWKTALLDAINNKLTISERFMLQIDVIRNQKNVASFIAINDGVVSGAGPAKIVSLGVNISACELGGYRSDGLLVATPTGSTAYSMAAGGPVLTPYMDAMVFTPLCPFTLSNRPLVIPRNEKLEIFVKSPQREKTMLTVDGQEFFDLFENDRILFSESKYRAKLFCPKTSTFFQVLRSKLNWSGGSGA